MSIAKSFQKDVFISYCHDDNVNPMAKKGWVDVFHEALLWRLKQRLGTRDGDQAPVIWRDNSLQGNDTFSTVLAEELQRVALVVSVLTPSYVNSPWCKTELETFVRAAQAQLGLRVGHKMRILKVVKTPVDRDAHPPVLQDETGFPFYAQGSNPANPREFTLADGDENAALAQRAIDDLAFSIEGVLKAINEQIDRPAAAALAAPVAPGAGAGAGACATVYLAECHWELDEARQQIRRELEEAGLNVLPAGDLPLRNPKQFRDAVQQALAASTLAVHLVSARRGAGVADETDDSVVLQNRLAAERSASSGLQRLVWLPDHLVGSAPVADASQQQFIDQLERDPATRSGAETLRMPLQDLITRIHETLHKQQRASEARQAAAAAALAAPAAGADGDAPSVYLMCHPDDAGLARTLGNHLYSLGLDVWKQLTDPDASEDELAADHLRKLGDCNAVLLCIGQARQGRAEALLSELQGAAGRRKGRPPLAARGLYIGPPDAAYKADLRAQGVLVCNGSAGFSAELLQPFVDRLRVAVQQGA